MNPLKNLSLGLHSYVSVSCRSAASPGSRLTPEIQLLTQWGGCGHISFSRWWRQRGGREEASKSFKVKARWHGPLFVSVLDGVRVSIPCGLNCHLYSAYDKRRWPGWARTTLKRVSICRGSGSDGVMFSSFWFVDKPVSGKKMVIWQS